MTNHSFPRRLVSAAFALSTYVDSARTVKNAALGSKARFTELAKALKFTRNETNEDLPENIISPEDKFTYYKQKYRRNETWLQDAQDTTHKYCLLYTALAIISLYVAFFSLEIFNLKFDFYDPNNWQVNPFLASIQWSGQFFINTLSRFLIVPVMLLFMVRSGFENWKIRNRKIDNLINYLKDDANFWSVPYNPSKNKKWLGIFSLAFGYLTLNMLVPQSAYADGEGGIVAENIFHILPDSDIWGQLLNFIFPGVGPLKGAVSAVSQGIATASFAFSAALQAVGMFMLSYTTLIGMIQTAHEGKTLGERWHTAFAPLRMFYGFGLLVPIAGGYSIAQILVVWVAIAGGQLGNVVWDGFIDGLTTTPIATPQLKQTIPTARDLFVMEVCAATSKRANDDLGVETPNYPPEWKKGNRGSGAAVFPKGGFFDFDVLGSANEKQPVESSVYILDYSPCGSVSMDIVDSGADGESTFDYARFAALQTLIDGVRPQAQILVKNAFPNGNDPVNQPGGTDFAVLFPEIYGSIMQAKNSYDRALTTASNGYVKSQSAAHISDFKKGLKEAGWASAGSYYITISRVATAINEVVGKEPTISNGYQSMKPTSSDTFAKMFYDPVVGLYPKIAKQWQDAVIATPTLSNAAARAGTHSGEQSDIGRFFVDLFSPASLEKLFNGNPSKLTSSGLIPGNAVQRMIDFGNQIIFGFWAIVGAAAALKLSGAGLAEGLLGSVAKTGFIGTFLETIVTSLSLLVIGLLAVGIVHAYVLPALPYIHFLFFTFGMLILVIEGFVAAPLWALAHVRPDGQEFIDHAQSAGYKILFNLLLRIPLALFGLFFSLLLFEAGEWFLSVTFYPAMISVQSGSTYGIFGILASVILITVLHYQLANRSFKLVTQLPDRVSRWFGASPDGDQHEAESHTAVGLVMSSSHRALGAVEKAGGGAFRTAGSKQSTAISDASGKAASEDGNFRNGGNAGVSTDSASGPVGQAIGNHVNKAAQDTGGRGEDGNVGKSASKNKEGGW